MNARPHLDALKVREGYWFARKLYGYGATPVTWQGWLTTLAYFIAIAAIAMKVPGHWLKAGLMLPLTVTYLYFVWTRTDGGFAWRWGPEKK